jgi:spore protease
MDNIKIKTDLAIETSEMLYKQKKINTIDGVKVEVEESEREHIKVTWVKIEDENGAEQMGKPIGHYVTVDSKAMKENDGDSHEEIIKVLSKSLGKLHNLEKDGVVLVVGLGNSNVTPDALGPKVVSKILVTRHIAGTEDVPEELQNKVRYVCAVTPGVMGVTGIETAEIIKGIVDKVKPNLIIAVDALASRHTSRVNSTIQMSNAGINPGSGVGNKRMGIDKESMGVPVIAIGVPTVVDAATLVNDTMSKILELMEEKTKDKEEIYGILEDLEHEERNNLIKEVLGSYTGNMFVTPKEVDEVINRLANIISNAINIAVHPGISNNDINRFFS